MNVIEHVVEGKMTKGKRRIQLVSNIMEDKSYVEIEMKAQDQEELRGLSLSRKTCCFGQKTYFLILLTFSLTVNNEVIIGLC